MHSRGVEKTDIASPTQSGAIKFSPLFASGEIEL